MRLGSLSYPKTNPNWRISTLGSFYPLCHLSARSSTVHLLPDQPLLALPARKRCQHLRAGDATPAMSGKPNTEEDFQDKRTPRPFLSPLCVGFSLIFCPPPLLSERHHGGVC